MKRQQLLIGSLLVTQLTACGTDDQLTSDVNLVFKDSSILGNNWRIIDFESPQLSNKALRIIQNRPYFATVTFLTNKPQQIQLFLGQNVLSYETLNRPLPAANAYSTFELSIIVPIQQDINEYILHLSIEGQK